MISLQLPVKYPQLPATFIGSTGTLISRIDTTQRGESYLLSLLPVILM